MSGYDDMLKENAAQSQFIEDLKRQLAAYGRFDELVEAVGEWREHWREVTKDSPGRSGSDYVNNMIDAYDRLKS